jgi:chromosome segregation ATPase
MSKMTMITPEQEIATSEEHFQALQIAIRDLRREIQSLKEQANSGEEINETAASKALARASGMVATCVKVENYLRASLFLIDFATMKQVSPPVAGLEWVNC